MAEYRLERLGWFNFEQLLCRLLRETVGPGISTFSGSTDQGRDATFDGAARFPSKSSLLKGKWIFQVKFRQWDTGGVSAVRAGLKKTLEKEVRKVVKKHKHKCDVYVFITNCPLTAKNKDGLSQIIKSVDSIRKGVILGNSDIEELLDLNPKVVRTFPQIMGIRQLREVMAWGINQRSIEYLRQAQEELETYVITEAYLNALDLLREQHFCILAGPPKMGKTCTAGALGAAYAASAYSVYELRSQRDFYDFYDREEKQFFICDDVFGDISLHSEKRDEWTQGLVRLISSLGENHKLVWTARSYILREAIQTSKLEEDRPSVANTDMVTVCVDDLKRVERAMILYNHAKKANLPKEVRKIIRESCVDIIDDDAFAPESIRQLCTGEIVKFAREDTEKTAVLKKIKDFLQSPGTAWKQAFKNAPSEVRFLCVAIMASGGSMYYDQLKEKYEEEAEKRGVGWICYLDAIKRAEGTFLKRQHMWGDNIDVRFYHPSMRDLLVEVIESDANVRGAYIEKLTMTELRSLMTDKSKLVAAETSMGHRIKLDYNKDIERLKIHLNEHLLPTVQVGDLNQLFVELTGILRDNEKADTPGSGGELSSILQLMLNSAAAEACSEAFWQRSQDSEWLPVPQWATFMERLYEVLLRATKEIVPLYVGNLLEKCRDYEDVDYWRLVMAAQKIVPVVVGRHVDMSEREQCRNSLSQNVQSAISEFSPDFGHDWVACNSWHEQYYHLPYQCRKYEQLFPEDEEISGWVQVESLADDYPEIDRDDAHEDDDLRGYGESVKTDTEIREIFGDL
jgi:hypothetical protein